MSSENHLADLLPGYALGTLDADELALVSEHIDHCDECQQELQEYKNVITEMLVSVPPRKLPKAARRQVMKQFRKSKRDVRQKLQISSTVGWRMIYKKSASALQPLAFLLIIALGISNFLLLQEIRNPGSVIDRSTNAVSDPRIVHLHSTDLAPYAQGAIILALDGEEGTLVVEGLPPLEEATYQMWLGRYDQHTNAGHFDVLDEGRHAFHITIPESLFNYSRFGITVEPSGGSPTPSGQQVMYGTLEMAGLFDMRDQ